MSRGEGLQRMILVPEATYRSLCAKTVSAQDSGGGEALSGHPPASVDVLDGPREVLGKNLAGMQQRLHDLDANIAANSSPGAVAHLQRSQLESKLLNARRAFFLPSKQERGVDGGPEVELQEASSGDESGVPVALRPRFRRLAAQLFGEGAREEGAEGDAPKNELTQQEVKDLMEYVVRDKPLKRHAKRPPGGLQNFLEFLRKQDVDPNLVGKHVRGELLKVRRAEKKEMDEGSTDTRPVDMRMLEDYETLA